MKFEEINPYIRYAQCFELKADTAFARVTPCDNRLFYTVSGDAEVTPAGIISALPLFITKRISPVVTSASPDTV